MTKRCCWESFLPILIWLTIGVSNDAVAQDRPNVLYLTVPAAWVQTLLPVDEEVFRGVGESPDAFDVTVIRSAEQITKDTLTNYDVVAFNTTGELPMAASKQEALLEFVRNGGGFVGVHSATDTFYEWPEYGEMLGGYFDGHPWHQEVGVTVEDADHPSTRHLESPLTLYEEIYQFKDWNRTDVHVLLSVDTTSVDMEADGINRTDGDFALSWTREYGNGRIFYTALGHEPATWRDSQFQGHLIGGVRWAAGLEE
ncbi:MAG: ThuA domain-containing protein [Acidobacteriota bacterium]|nr:ThuA domain-containing protein [Acidobacteriota bacterium]